jgi:hypothetical protein
MSFACHDTKSTARVQRQRVFNLRAVSYALSSVRISHVACGSAAPAKSLGPTAIHGYVSFMYTGDGVTFRRSVTVAVNCRNAV